MLFNNILWTERGDAAVIHWAHIREVPGSNPGADHFDWDFFVVFISYEGKCSARFSLQRVV